MSFDLQLHLKASSSSFAHLCDKIFSSLGRSVILFRMSAQEIIAELAKLKPEELRLVKEKLDRLNAESAIPQTGWGRVLFEMAGKVDDLPADLSLQHDHYLYGTPKR
jgi:hypothetical protein